MTKYEVISGPYFPVFRLNTGKYGSDITPCLDTFHAVLDVWQSFECTFEIFPFFILYRISFWEWYVLSDLNENQKLPKLVYCWFIYRDFAFIFIVSKNSKSLFFYLLLTFNVRKQKSFILYQEKHSSHYYLVNKWGAIVTNCIHITVTSNIHLQLVSKSVIPNILGLKLVKLDCIIIYLDLDTIKKTRN